MPNDTFGSQKPKIRSVCKNVKNAASSIQKPASTSAEECNKTESTQRKPNKPISQQTNEDAKYEGSAQLSRAVARQLQTPTNDMGTNLQKPTSHHTFQQRELLKQKPNGKDTTITSEQADQNIARPASKQSATAKGASGRGEVLRHTDKTARCVIRSLMRRGGQDLKRGGEEKTRRCVDDSSIG